MIKTIILRFYGLLFTILMGTSSLFAQKIVLDVQHQSLNQVLLNLNDQYDIQFSINHQLGEDCFIDLHQTFSSTKAAFTVLLEPCHLRYEESDGVFIILKKELDPILSEKKASFKKIYSGQLIDAKNAEPLPFSSITINSKNIVADASGHFYYQTTHDSADLVATYLGYYVLDTILQPGNNQQIPLHPSVVGLNEIEIQSAIPIHSSLLGERAGLLRLNHNISTFLPGNNNNSLFNLLRLQPGISAATELNGDYIIWGSYRGQNLFQFDGMTIFNATSLNNEIGVINPLLLKEIEVHKGGFQVDKGDRVGVVSG